MPRLWAVLLSLSCAAAFAAEPPDLGTRKDGADWPHFLGPTGDSVSAERGIISPWPKEGLKIIWQVALGAGYAPPAVSRGRLFHFDAVAGTARLTCRNSETGQQLWKFEYPTNYEDYFGYDNGPRCSPLVDADRVYVYGAEGVLHCLRIEDGKALWKVDTFPQYGVIQNFFGVGGCPILDGDLIIVPVGGSPKGSDPQDFMGLKGNGTAIVAFDKFTGKEKYRVGNELAGYSTPTIATLGGKRLGLYFARGGLLAFDPGTGQQAFHFPWRARTLECVNASNPVVVDGRVLLTECYGPGAVLLKAKGGGVEVVWSDTDKGRSDRSLPCHWNTPIHRDGYLYASAGRHTGDAELRCVELATGKLMWKRRGLTRSSLLMVDDRFVCMCEDGTLLLLKVNPKKFDEVSRWDLGDAGLLQYPCWAAPVLSHGLMYLRGKEKLLCLELIPAKK
ncbi:MAG: PQQ-binding-like beta-propeller repeat protein [Gemmataceae bacterium]